MVVNDYVLASVLASCVRFRILTIPHDLDGIARNYPGFGGIFLLSSNDLVVFAYYSMAGFIKHKGMPGLARHVPRLI